MLLLIYLSYLSSGDIVVAPITRYNARMDPRDLPKDGDNSSASGQCNHPSSDPKEEKREIIHLIGIKK